MRFGTMCSGRLEAAEASAVRLVTISNYRLEFGRQFAQPLTQDLQ